MKPEGKVRNDRGRKAKVRQKFIEQMNAMKKSKGGMKAPIKGSPKEDDDHDGF